MAGRENALPFLSQGIETMKNTYRTIVIVDRRNRKVHEVKVVEARAWKMLDRLKVKHGLKAIVKPS